MNPRDEPIRYIGQDEIEEADRDFYGKYIVYCVCLCAVALVAYWLCYQLPFVVAFVGRGI